MTAGPHPAGVKASASAALGKSLLDAEGILSAVGNTPLVRLTRLFKDQRLQLYAKLEGLNPGGSIKDRPALVILREALESGTIVPGSVIIESSSGNMAIGLAQACSYLGLRLICVVDPKTTAQNRAILRAYGADIELVTEPDPVTNEYLPARLRRVRELVDRMPGAFWSNQYANLANPRAHQQTMREIVTALEGRVDYVFCATSTCGTLRGCSEYLVANQVPAQLVAVDAVGSVIFGRKVAKRLIPGHGAAVRPALFVGGLAGSVVHVSDLDCVIGCRRLVLEEAILAGGSSGAIVTAIARMLLRIPVGSTCVAILPDRGERYLDTIYSDAWVKEHFGDVSTLWERVA